MRSDSRRSDAVANRDKVIAAAHAVFLEKGVRAEMREVAQRAGVGIGTVYRNFPSKDELIIGLIHAGQDEGLAHWERVRAEPPLDAIKELAVSNLRLSVQFRWLLPSLVAGQLSTRIQGDLAVRSQEYDLAGQYEFHIRRAIEAGELRGDCPVDVVALLFAALSVPWINHALLETRTPEQVAATVLETMLSGLNNNG